MPPRQTHARRTGHHRPRWSAGVEAGSGHLMRCPRSNRRARVVSVAGYGRPPLSSLITSCTCVIPPVLTNHCSRWKVVPGGAKLYSCRTTSRYVWPPSRDSARWSSCVWLTSCAGRHSQQRWRLAQRARHRPVPAGGALAFGRLCSLGEFGIAFARRPPGQDHHRGNGIQGVIAGRVVAPEQVGTVVHPRNWVERRPTLPADQRMWPRVVWRAHV